MHAPPPTRIAAREQRAQHPDSHNPVPTSTVVLAPSQRAPPATTALPSQLDLNPTASVPRKPLGAPNSEGNEQVRGSPTSLRSGGGSSVREEGSPRTQHDRASLDGEQGMENGIQSGAKLPGKVNAARMTNDGKQGALSSLTSSKAPQRGKRKLGGVVWTFGAADKRVQGRIPSPPPPTAITSSISRSQEPAASRRNDVAIDNLPPAKVGSGGRRPGGSPAPRGGKKITPGVGSPTDRGHHGDGNGSGDETPAATNGSSKRRHTSDHSRDGGVDAAVSLRVPRRSENKLHDGSGSPSISIGERSTDELASPSKGGSCRPSSPNVRTSEIPVGNANGVVRSHPKDIATSLDDAVSLSAAGVTTTRERSSARRVTRPPAHENDTAVVSIAGDASAPCSGPSKEETGHEGGRAKAAAAMPAGSGQEKTAGRPYEGAREEKEEDAAMAGTMGIRLKWLTGDATNVTAVLFL